MAGGGDPRESATESKPPDFNQVRVKGCGKSAPRAWQQGRHGKPHREQNQIGTADAGNFLLHKLVFRAAVRVGCMRCLVTGILDEWSSIEKSRTKPGLQVIWQ